MEYRDDSLLNIYDFHYVKLLPGRMLRMATLSHRLENRVSCAVV